jgi:uncharacterized protein (DUF1778 family)
MIESARDCAIEALLDRRLFLLDQAGSKAFWQLLENAPAPVEALRTLMKSTAPWEWKRERLTSGQ